MVIKDKHKDILLKGDMMTFSEIEWLLNRGVTKKIIRNHVRMDTVRFTQYLHNHGISTKRRNK